MFEYGGYQGELVAGCRVDGATGLLVGNPLRVLSSVKGPGLGSYLITLPPGLGVDNLDAICLATTRQGVANRLVDAVQLSDTVIAVTTGDTAGEAADASFHLGIFRTNTP